jgi:excisionase family DNA binding protein
MEKDQNLEGFLRKLIIAAPCKRDAVIKSGLVQLSGSPPPDQLLYSGAQACRMLAISQPTLYRMKKAGTIKPVFLRSRPRYKREDLVRLAGGAA